MFILVESGAQLGETASAFDLRVEQNVGLLRQRDFRALGAPKGARPLAWK